MSGRGEAEAAALREDLRQGGPTPGDFGKVECGSCGVFVRSRREHICLAPTPEKRVACRGPKGLARCGRVYGAVGWWFALPGEDLDALEQGICPACMVLQITRAEKQRAREGR